MSKTAKKQHKTTEPENITAPRIEAEPQELVRAIAEFSAALPPGSPRLWPAMVGTTGVGKTSTARAVAEATKRPLRPLLLGTMDPVDIGGVPERTDGVFRWARPAWSHEPRALIFLDELDKAREEHYAAILTMMSDLALHGIPLGEGAAIVAAAQPEDLLDLPTHDTGRALCARVVWVPMTRNIEYLRKVTRGMKLDWLPASTPPRLPYLEYPSDRQVYWLALFGVAHPDLVEQVAMLTLGPHWGPLWIADWRAMHQGGCIEMPHLHTALKARPEALENMEIPVLVAVIRHIGGRPDGDLKVWGKAIEEIIARGSIEEVKGMLREFHLSILEQWENKEKDATDIQLFGDATPVEYSVELNRAIREGVRRLAKSLGQTIEGL